MSASEARRGDHGERSDRVRSPVKGLRQRLRIALKAAGVTSKFRTDHLRDGSLIVKSVDAIVLPFKTFEGLSVHFSKVPS